jgi:hypothetical protein
VPRDDSQLTYNYATGHVDDFMDNPQIIARELHAVNQIYTMTDYKDILEDTMRQIAYYLKEKHRFLNWNEVWSITKFYVPDMVKMHCVHKYNLKIKPEFIESGGPETAVKDTTVEHTLKEEMEESSMC